MSAAIFPNGIVAFQPAVQYKWNKRYALQADVAAPLPSSLSHPGDKLWRTTLQIKRYFIQPKSKRLHYAALQAGYFYRRFVDEGSGFYYTSTKNNAGFAYSNAVIHSPVLTLSLNAGLTWLLTKKIYADFFLGAGARRIATRYDAKNEVATFGAANFGIVPRPAYDYNLTLLRLHATAGVRLGWQF